MGPLARPSSGSDGVEPVALAHVKRPLELPTQHAHALLLLRLRLRLRTRTRLRTRVRRLLAAAAACPRAVWGPRVNRTITRRRALFPVSLLAAAYMTSCHIMFSDAR